MTNCTQKNIRAIVGQINGQYRQIGGIWLDVKIKNKKIRKKFSENDFILRLKFSEKNFLQKSRNDSVVRKTAKPGCGLSFAPIQKTANNTRAARSYRIYIYVLWVTTRARFCLYVRSIVPSWNTRLKTAAKHHDNILPTCKARGRRV